MEVGSHGYGGGGERGHGGIEFISEFIERRSMQQQQLFNCNYMRIVTIGIYREKKHAATAATQLQLHAS
jgi:hypothetical protein